MVATSPLAFEGYDAGVFPSSVAIGDFNGDGKNDVAVVGTYGPATISNMFLQIYFGDGQGGFTSSSYSLLASILNPTIATFDQSADGSRRLVIAFNGAGALGQFLGSSFLIVTALQDGGLATEGSFASSMTETAAPGLAVADFNSDGLSDVAILNPSTGIDVFYGLTGGGFAQVALRGADGYFAPPTIGYGVPTSPSSQIAAGDLDGDGRADLAIVSASFLDGGNFRGAPTINMVGAFLQTSDGGLAPLGPQFLDLSYPVFYQAPIVVGHRLLLGLPGEFCTVDGGRLLDCTGPLGFSGGPVGASADLNQDGIPDVLLTGPTQHLQAVLGHLAPNNYGIPFGRPVTPLSPGAYLGVPTNLPVSIAVGDLNGDGRPDVAVVGTGPYAETAILLNQCAP
jgi:hypothetical protein